MIRNASFDAKNCFGDCATWHYGIRLQRCFYLIWGFKPKEINEIDFEENQ